MPPDVLRAGDARAVDLEPLDADVSRGGAHEDEVEEVGGPGHGRSEPIARASPAVVSLSDSDLARAGGRVDPDVVGGPGVPRLLDAHVAGGVRSVFVARPVELDVGGDEIRGVQMGGVGRHGFGVGQAVEGPLDGVDEHWAKVGRRAAGYSNDRVNDGARAPGDISYGGAVVGDRVADPDVVRLGRSERRRATRDGDVGRPALQVGGIRPH